MKLRSWGFEKNISEQEMKTILAIQKKRTSENKTTEFFHHESRIAAEKIESFKKRRCFKDSTVELWSTGMQGTGL